MKSKSEDRCQEDGKKKKKKRKKKTKGTQVN